MAIERFKTAVSFWLIMPHANDAEKAFIEQPSTYLLPTIAVVMHEKNHVSRWLFNCSMYRKAINRLRKILRDA